MFEISSDYESMFNNTVNALAKYIDDTGLQSLVLGVSGGIDSAVIAALAYHAVRRSKVHIPIIGRSITIESNKEDEIARAHAIGLSFCDDFKELDLTPLYHCFLTDHEFEKGLSDKIAKGNIKARLRMIQLYHLAGITKGMVLSTDNYTELMVGFWTLHGDVGDYGMIQNLFKTEVYGLAEWIADRDLATRREGKAQAMYKCIDATPTDGLGISNSDLDQLGAGSYEEVDNILIDFLNNGQHCEDFGGYHPVIKRHLATQFKRDNPYNIPREDILK